MNESIGKKIWNYTISVGQIITTFLIGCAVALVMWLFVQIFRPSKLIFYDRPVNDKKLALSEESLWKHRLFLFYPARKIQSALWRR